MVNHNSTDIFVEQGPGFTFPMSKKDALDDVHASPIAAENTLSEAPSNTFQDGIESVERQRESREFGAINLEVHEQEQLKLTDQVPATNKQESNTFADHISKPLFHDGGEYLCLAKTRFSLNVFSTSLSPLECVNSFKGTMNHPFGTDGDDKESRTQIGGYMSPVSREKNETVKLETSSDSGSDPMIPKCMEVVKKQPSFHETEERSLSRISGGNQDVRKAESGVSFEAFLAGHQV